VEGVGLGQGDATFAEVHSTKECEFCSSGIGESACDVLCDGRPFFADIQQPPAYQQEAPFKEVCFFVKWARLGWNKLWRGTVPFHASRCVDTPGSPATFLGCRRHTTEECRLCCQTRKEWRVKLT